MNDSEEFSINESYFVRVRGKTQGPFDIQTLQSLARRGKFARHNEVSVDGIEWHKASDYPELFPERKKRKPKPEPEEVNEEVYDIEDDPDTDSADEEYETDWHVVLDGKKYGPITKTEIKELIDDGSLPNDSLVWHAKLDDWTPLIEVEDFSSITSGGSPGLNALRGPRNHGSATPSQSKYCHACSTILDQRAEICPQCGVRQADDPFNSGYRRQRPKNNLYAGFWKRVGALLLDSFILLILTAGAGFVLGFTMYSIGVRNPDLIVIIANLVGIIISWLYFACQESSLSQATLGKKALGIIVTDMDGHPISFGKATGRYFGKIISSIFLIGYIMTAFTDKKQALHDMMSGCLVVNE